MHKEWDRLNLQLLTGSIGRREFLAGAAALGVTAATAGEALAQTPKRGGNLIMGINQGGSADTLDSQTWNAEYQFVLGNQVYDMLTTVNEKSQVKPSLAESWEPSKDVKTWVFKIRKGVTFHNGKALTADDVVYSINHHRGADSKSMVNSMLSPITDVKASGPNEVTITLSSGNADLPYLLADWHVAIVPDGSKYDGVGTGAFVLEKFEPGVRALTKRNANDWRKDRGYVDTVESLVINDPTARVQALLSGAVHIINRIATSTVGPLEKNANIQILSATGGSHPTMSPLCDAPPYNNLDLRLALAYAVDREALLKTVFRGYGKLGNDHPVPSYDPMFAADIPQRKYDPDKAKFHLKKSGYTAPVTFTVSDAAFSGATEAAQVYQSSASKAGINFQIDRVPNDGYYAKYWQKVPFIASTYGGRSTADIILTQEFSSPSKLNESHWKNEKFDQLLIQARAELDTKKRKQMYHDLQLMVHDDVGSIIAIFNNTIDGCSKKLKGFIPSPVQQFSAYRATEEVWFA